jgi:AcrR family transcriptional regulator
VAIPTAHGLARQLHRLLPFDHLLPGERGGTSDPGPTAEERILDAALARFAEYGVGVTTMSAIARDTGISREWLYRHFRNRDAVVIAVTTREVSRLIDGLAEQAELADDLESIITEAFSYAVEFLGEHALLQQVLRNEPDILSSVLLDQGGSVLTTAVDVSVVYLTAIAPFETDQAVTLAETLVRLVVAITLAPQGRLDLRDPDELRRFGRSVVSALLPAAVTAASTARLSAG